MRTLYITIIFVMLMAFIIPFHKVLAVSASSPLYTHFVYMFGHAGFVHWAINGWCIIMLHHHFRPFRFFVAWCSSVLLSFVYHPSLPVLGISVLISFFMGHTAQWLYTYKRFAFWQMMILLVFGCFLPQIAGIYHLILFTVGFLYAKVESIVRRILSLKD